MAESVGMLERILPRTINNCYSGHNLAIWCMIVIVFLKAGMGLTSMFASRLAAQNAHKVPLGAFPRLQRNSCFQRWLGQGCQL